MPYDFTDKEWNRFSRIERKIIVFIKDYKIEDTERLRLLLGWPLDPMPKSSFRRNWSSIMKKVRMFRNERHVLIGEIK